MAQRNTIYQTYISLIKFVSRVLFMGSVDNKKNVASNKTFPLSHHSSMSCVELFQYAAAAGGWCEIDLNGTPSTDDVNMWVCNRKSR